MIISKKDFYSQQSTGFKNNQNEVPSDDMPVSANLLSDGHYYILSRFADEVWRLPDSAFPQNRSEYEKKISFKQIPLQFRATLKIIILKYLLFGLAGSKKPSGGTVFSFFKRASLFLNYLDSININSLSAVTELICANYTHHCSQIINKNTGKKLASNTLSTRFNSLEALYKLSQNTVDVMVHPWPDSSSAIISGITKKIKTKIIPDEILSQLFNAAMDKINEASKLLELRDGVDQIKKKNSKYTSSVVCSKVNHYLEENNFHGGGLTFNNTLESLFTACMIVVFITCGIRVHELASLKTGCGYIVTGDDEENYYWIKGRSEKTHEGNTEWLATKITYTAIKIIEQLILPLQNKLTTEVNERLSIDPRDNEAILLLSQCKNLFLRNINHEIKTLTNKSINDRIKKFARDNKINWNFSTHQFRRTFAVYAARSVYGSLLYLKEHFKHWCLDMSALYALNEQQDADLYNEILLERQNEQISIVEHWLDENTTITGGMADQIKSFRGKNEPVKTYKSRRDLAEKVSELVYIRSTAVAWCTADAGECGRSGIIDMTQCGDCHNAVIDDRKKDIWKNIYEQQIELLNIDDIGPSGRERVERDIKRCEHVLKELEIEHHLEAHS